MPFFHELDVSLNLLKVFEVSSSTHVVEINRHIAFVERVWLRFLAKVFARVDPLVELSAELDELILMFEFLSEVREFIGIVFKVIKLFFLVSFTEDEFLGGV